ncbi:hypothetical protein [Amycolatopsis palatopharyngis]|uniref:hypothetical protein n=1 Tax=Amycolatopsis palatopharyngis TaxID=187982 RepID=UPI000E225026|nr:hypothetical protein [Amycolatopsis palatopharyngis]
MNSKLVIAFSTLAAGIAAGALTGCGSTTGSPMTAAAITSAPPETETTTVTATVTETVTETVTTEPPPPPGPKVEFGPGTWEVGVDVQPGKYKTAGPDGGLPCYWARLKDTSGDLGSIINNSILEGPGTVTINKGELFETSGCQDWIQAA